MTFDAGLVPVPFVAVTDTLYAVPLVSPPIVVWVGDADVPVTAGPVGGVAVTVNNVVAGVDVGSPPPLVEDWCRPDVARIVAALDAAFDG